MALDLGLIFCQGFPIHDFHSFYFSEVGKTSQCYRGADYSWYLTWRSLQIFVVYSFTDRFLHCCCKRTTISLSLCAHGPSEGRRTFIFQICWRLGWLDILQIFKRFPDHQKVKKCVVWTNYHRSDSRSLLRWESSDSEVGLKWHSEIDNHFQFLQGGHY